MIWRHVKAVNRVKDNSLRGDALCKKRKMNERRILATP